jgi:hypothetical protein
MRAVALCWELGDGFGHLAKLRSLIRIFRERGFRVFLILRSLSSAARLFDPASPQTAYSVFSYFE